MENPKREKPREPTDSNYHYERKDTMGDSKATTSSSVFSNRRLQRKDFLYLSLSLCNLRRTIKITTTMSDCPKSYLYLYDFTNMSLHPVCTSHRACTIRRDLFPNKLPLHSGMGCLVNPIRLWYRSSFLADNTLVSLSDPFSSVWIFVREKSLSSIFSRSQ